jgi:PAS domain S-box-containing protein
VLKGKTTDLKKLSPGDAQSLIHELEVHQVELEMQNEELRTVQQELEEAKDRYSDLYDFAPLSYFTFDKNGLILQVNLTGANKLGIERSFLIKKPFSLYIAPDHKDAFYSHLRHIFDTKTQATCELQLVDKKGHKVDALLESMPAHESDGNLLARTAMSDITQRKRAEEVNLRFTEELEQRVRERTAELEKKTADLEIMIKGFVDRELRMIELKKRIAEHEK